MKVLVASTENIVRHIAAKALTPAGYSVTGVATGQQAWDFIDQETGPLITVLDWQMPSYDGLTICRTLRTTNFRDYVYVLLLTSRKNKMDELVALESGIDDYLQKPFLADELLARVNIGKRVVAHERKLSAIISDFRSMVDLSPFPQVCLDHLGIIRRTNLPFASLAGTHPPAEYLGLAIADVLSLNVHESNFLLRHIQEEKRLEALPWHPFWKNAAAALTPALITGPTELYGRPVKNNTNISYILTITNGLTAPTEKKPPTAVPAPTPAESTTETHTAA